MDMLVQAKENGGQSGHKRVWDMFLSIIGNCEIELAECVGRLLYGLAIVIVLKKFVVGLDSSKRESVRGCVLLE